MVWSEDPRLGQDQDWSLPCRDRPLAHRETALGAIGLGGGSGQSWDACDRLSHFRHVRVYVSHRQFDLRLTGERLKLFGCY